MTLSLWCIFIWLVLQTQYRHINVYFIIYITSIRNRGFLGEQGSVEVKNIMLFHSLSYKKIPCFVSREGRFMGVRGGRMT